MHKHFALLPLLLATPALALETPTLSLTPDPLPLPDSPVLLLGSPKQFNTTHAVRLTLYWENDGGWAKPIDRHDRHYTSGTGAAITWQAPWVNDLLSQFPSFADEFPTDKSDYAMGLVGALTMFTPDDIANPSPIFNDHPYAGWTYAGLFIQRANRLAAIPMFESLELDLGLVGPSSLAQNAQELVHHTLEITRPRGWDHQIHDEPEFALKYNRRWRIDLFQNLADQFPHAPRFQMLPDAGFTAGTLLDEAHAGALFRLGWNLPDDFGPGFLARPADFTYEAPCTCDELSLSQLWNKQSFTLFARPYAMLVAHNVLLQGDNFRNADLVTLDPQPFVAGIEYGLTHRLLKHLEFTYAWTTQSREFKGQRGLDTWASVSLSFVIAW